MTVEGVSVFKEFPRAKHPTLVGNRHVGHVVISSVIHDSRDNDLTAVKRLVGFSNTAVATPPGLALTDRWLVGFLDRAMHGVVRYG